MKLVVTLLACGLASLAAGIDGHWNVEAAAKAKKAADQPPASLSLDLKTVDGNVTGTVAIPGKKRPQFQKVENAKFDGTHLNFTTTQKGKNSSTFTWQATLDGDQLALTRSRDGAKGSKKFTAKRN